MGGGGRCLWTMGVGAYLFGEGIPFTNVSER